MARMRTAVLVSGRGSNLQALIDAAKDPAYPAEIAAVISNVPGVYALERAAEAGIDAFTINHKDFDSRETFEDALHDKLKEIRADLVCLAGFMRLLTDGFVQRWRDRLVNIHPSLLPAFKGIHVHEQVVESGVRFSGCTVHFVRPAMDDGPIIIQAVVPVCQSDDADALAARVLEQEHVVYPQAVSLIAERRVRVVDERVIVDKPKICGGSMVSPLVE